MRSERERNERRAAWAAIVALALAVAGLAACGADGTERARADGGDVSERVEGVTSASSTDDLRGRELAPIAAGRPDGAPATDPASEPVEPPTNVTYEDAEEVFRSGEYGEAVELFEAYTERRPDDPWGHYMLGLSARRSGDAERAEAALRRTLELDSMHVKGRVNLARVLLERGGADEALEHIERAVDLRPESGASWRVLGNVRAELGRTDEAVEAYREALVLDHEDAWSMNNVALLLIREGRYEDALPPLARATELRPDVAVFQNNLGIALERGGHLGGAAEAFRTALAVDDGHEKARVSLERVEARAPEETGEPFDLAELASAFADEVETWTARGLNAQPAEEVTESESPDEADVVNEPRDEADDAAGAPVRDRTKGPDEPSDPDGGGSRVEADTISRS